MSKQEQGNNLPQSSEKSSDLARFDAQNYALTLVDKEIERIGELVDANVNKRLPPGATFEEVKNANSILQDLSVTEKAVKAGDMKVIKELLVGENNKLEKQLKHATAQLVETQEALTVVTEKLQQSVDLSKKALGGVEKQVKQDVERLEAEMKEAAKNLREKFNNVQMLQQDLDNNKASIKAVS